MELGSEFVKVKSNGLQLPGMGYHRCLDLGFAASAGTKRNLKLLRLALQLWHSLEFTLNVTDFMTFMHGGLDQARQWYHTVQNNICWLVGNCCPNWLLVLPKCCLLVCSLACYRPTKEQLLDKMLSLAIFHLPYLGKEKKEVSCIFHLLLDGCLFNSCCKIFL